MSSIEIEPGTIAHYQLEYLLARGGMSVVYLARDIHTDQQVAIKLVHASEHDYYERFQREANTLASLKNEHILPIFDYGAYESWFYMTMPYIEYGSLRDRLAKGTLPLQEAETLFTQLVDAVQYAHEQGILHRDIKPSNILLRDGKHVYLADFGLVKHVEELSDLTQTNCLLGTPEYMAPELAECPATVSSDIYALGVVFYYMLTGHVPFKSNTPLGVYWKHLHEQPVAPSTYNQALSLSTDQVILHALAKEPEQRFQSAEAMRVALRHCLPNSAAPATVQIPAISPNATIVVPASPLICPKCHFQNRPVAKFCKNCGQPLTAGATLVPPRVAAQTTIRAPIRAKPVQSTDKSAVGMMANQSAMGTTNRPLQAPNPIRARPVQAADPVGAYRLGLQYLNSKNYVEAVNQFKLALAKGASYDVLYNLGRAYRQYGQSLQESNKKQATENLQLAAEQLEEALRYKADALDTYFQRGMCYRDLGLYTQAANAFKKGLSLAPNDPAIYYQLGMTSTEQGYNREAEAYFLDGLRIAPDHGLILVALGRLLIKMRQYASAVKTLQRATQIDPLM